MTPPSSRQVSPARSLASSLLRSLNNLSPADRLKDVLRSPHLFPCSVLRLDATPDRGTNTLRKTKNRGRAGAGAGAGTGAGAGAGGRWASSEAVAGR